MASCPHMNGEVADVAACPHMSAQQTLDDSAHAKKDVKIEPIPQPPQHLFGLLGNLPDMDPSFPFKEIWRLLSIYGPIMKLNLDEERVFVGNQELVNEICDPTRFQKAHLNVLEEIRFCLYDGLFTAYNDEPNWGRAHRMLVPSFGPLGIRKMWSGMQDIASQMILKWDRLGPNNEIECSDDLTRLAFDTIGLCAFSFRFNQFYSDKGHPFAQQMGDVLKESGAKANRPRLIQALHKASEQQRQANSAAMHALCDEIISDRIKTPQPDNQDLLNVMLNSVDRETGEGLSPENIRYQLCTFLVAGHETTSATLSFTYYNLIKHPEKMLKAQSQVDEVVGNAVLTPEHATKLSYIDACIKETLRLNSPINGSTLASKEDQIIGGKYRIPAGTTVTFVSRLLHRDPKVWGEDAEEFKPERFLDGGFARLPPNSWKPFGTGARACIGRAFAEQEMVMNIAMVLQRFQLEFADPNYELQLKSTLTIKPAGFKMRVRRRPDRPVYIGIPGGVQQQDMQQQKANMATNSTQPADSSRPLHIFFGGNSGTCEAYAQELETAAKAVGMDASVGSLDSATENIPKGPVVIISSSYEGLPPDNAKKFVAWLENLQHEQKPLDKLECAVFGVGNSDWASTYHRIPKLVYELAMKSGAKSILEPGFVNVKEDIVGPWEEWLGKLMNVLAGDAAEGRKPQSTVEIDIKPSPLQNSGNQATSYGTILINKQLADTSVGLSKRHIEVRLPQEVHYSAGDYLVVYPHNHPENVHRVAAFFDLNESDLIQVKGSLKKHLPAEPTPIGEFLSTAVELSNPITKRQLELVAEKVPKDVQPKIAALIDSYPDLLAKRFTVLDVLEENSSKIPFSLYVDMLPALLPRQYSISSLPLKEPHTVSLTIDIHETPAQSGHGMFHGVASTFLASRLVGDRITCSVRPTQVGFRIPPPSTPLIMIAAGTGIAPMKAFLEERAAIAEAGTQSLGPAVLYFGCRHQDKDFIYRDQLLEWENKGIVKIKPAFSKMDDHPHQYVPDVIWQNKDEIADMFHDGGKIFLCGSAAKLGRSTAEVCKKIYSERMGVGADEAETWLQSVKTNRYVSDVY